MYQKPTSPLSIGGVLDDGFKLIRASYKKLLALSFVSSIAGMLPELIPGGSSLADPDPTAQLIPLLILMPLQIILFGALIAQANAVAESEEISLGEAVRVGLGRFLPLILCGFLYVIAVLLGFIALVVPFVILSLSLSMSMYLVVTDNMGAVESLKASHNLVWGNWWRTAALLVVVMFIVVAGFMIVGLVGAVIGGGAAAMEAESIGIVALALLTLLTALVNPLMYAFYIAILNDLKLRKQGDDLDDRIGALEEN